MSGFFAGQFEVESTATWDRPRGHGGRHPGCPDLGSEGDIFIRLQVTRVKIDACEGSKE